MPGIVGLITKMPRFQAEPELERMVTALCHESFYEKGTWIDESIGVYIGWVARKSSSTVEMPLRNEAGDVSLVFSGEDFSEAGTVNRLRTAGHSFNVDGPSYLVHLCEEDPRFPAGLNGRFHGLSVDKRKKTITLFNDRYGMHRIYYHESAEAFYFAAEAKAILACRPELRKIDNRSLGEFVACGCVLENRTLFEGIHAIPPGSAWVFRDSLIHKKSTYFEPREWEDQGTLEPEAYYQRLREVFSEVLPRYFRGPEPIGVSLTGGLDTRMIMAWHKSPPQSLPCYSFGGTFRDSQDVLIARRVARACGQSHEVIEVGEEFLSRFSHHAERTVYLTDGCADVSRSSDLYVNAIARNIAAVRMTGNYGGEVLRRVRAFKPTKPIDGLFREEFLSYVSAASGTYAGIIQGHPLTFAVFRQAPWHHYGLLDLEETQLTLRSPFLDNDLVKEIFRAPAKALINNDISLRLIADGNPALRRLRTDRGVGGNAAYQSYLEFTYKAEYAYNHGMPNWLAKIDHVLSPFHLERLFLGRHKFYHFRIWYRDRLAQYLREMLLDQRSLSRPYIERKGVETIVNRHLKGNFNYTNEIHQLLTVELIHRLFVDPA